MPELRDRIKELRRVRARDLHPNPKNWRRHPKAQSSALLALLEDIGIANASIARELPDGTLELIDGHLRQDVVDADQLVPVLILDVTEEEADKLLLTLDPLAAMAETDRALVARLRDSVTLEDQRVATLLEAINRQAGLSARGLDGKSAPDAIPPVTEERAVLGDVWHLGGHRIICGDATSLADYKRLMGGDGASLVFTDPPYGVSYVGSANFAAIRNDDKQRGDLTAFLRRAFRLIREQLLPNAAVYIWHASATRAEYDSSLRHAGLEELQYLIWVKPNLVLGHADYQWQHEPCFYAARRGEQPPFYGPRTETTAWHVTPGGDGQERAISLGNGVLLTYGSDALFVAPIAPRSSSALHVPLEEDEVVELVGDQSGADVWQISRDPGKAEHPTQKPVALAERAIGNSSLPGQIVLDAFLGSGSTLIAAERLQRRCFGIEIDPHYVDVAIARWESFTGRKATLAERPDPGA